MPFLRDSQGRLIRKDGSLVEGAQKGRKAGPRKTPIRKSGRISHLRVDALLGGEGAMRDEYERLLADPPSVSPGEARDRLVLNLRVKIAEMDAQSDSMAGGQQTFQQAGREFLDRLVRKLSSLADLFARDALPWSNVKAELDLIHQQIADHLSML